jgi:NAD(P)-dependent dehydrogenase (short-subunit alcohol dehydrogenase family)
MPATKRVAFTVNEKVALRKQHAHSPALSQKGLCQWFEESFGKPIRQATVSEVLSSRYSHLDEQITPSQALSKKQRLQAYPALEEALSQWYFAHENAPGDEAVRSRARSLWRELPQYQSQQEPAFSEGWLANFKRRYGIKQSASASGLTSIMTKRLSNRTALVTGSSGSLGQAIALALASEGANICCVDLFASPRNQVNPFTGKADDYHNRAADAQTTLSLLQDKYGADRAIFVKADVTSPAAWQDAINACVAKFGRLDILCNNAGISVESTHERPLPVHETSEEDWDRTLAINSKSVFLGCKYGITQFLTQDPLPGARDRGCIVNTSSVQALVAYHNTPAYCASKGAVSMLSKQVALDYAKEKIRW